MIPGSLLSSGYYEYDTFGAAEFIINKPKDAGKDNYFLIFLLIFNGKLFLRATKIAKNNSLKVPRPKGDGKVRPKIS